MLKILICKVLLRLLRSARLTGAVNRYQNDLSGCTIFFFFLNDKLIGWEFRLDHLGFEGFEFYEKSDSPDTYLMHAEYATNDDFRTVIHGKIWRPVEETKE